MALRDQPILDKFQGEIFRLPFDRQVLLLGPPGSGKTTTLIKRLAQKKTPEAVSDREKMLISEYARGSSAGSSSWAMFSPAELLKQYLGDAFNLEGVPDANNVRTWEKERHDLARNVLNILRSNNSGRFQLDDCPKLLIDHSSRGNVRLHDAFASYVEVTVLRRCNDALAALIKSNDEPVRRQALSLQRTLGASKQIGLDDVLRLLDQASNLQVEAKRLGNEIVTELNKIINLLLNTHRQLLREIALALPKIRAEVEDDEDDEDEEAEEVEGAPATSEVRALHALTGALRGWARAIADGRRSISGRSGRIIDLLGSRLPDDQRFGAIGVRIATRSQLRTIVQAPRDFVLGAPRMYAQFRREALRKAQHFSAGEETGGLSRAIGLPATK
jgi:GTPase SAR1 family protein